MGAVTLSIYIFVGLIIVAIVADAASYDQGLGGMQTMSEQAYTKELASAASDAGQGFALLERTKGRLYSVEMGLTADESRDAHRVLYEAQGRIEKSLVDAFGSFTGSAITNALFGATVSFW